MRYLKDVHANKNQKDSKIYNFLFFNDKALIVPSRIAIVAFCMNPNGPGAKSLIQLSLKNNNIQLFVRQLDLTDSESIKTGVNFITDLLQQNIDQFGKHNETGHLKFSLYKIQNV